MATHSHSAELPVSAADGARTPAGDTLTDADYQRLAELRYGLRSFLHWSAEQAKRAGLTPTQHQLLLAVRASQEERGPTVSDVAAVLLIRHHSAVELVDRAQEAG
jgi:DNA-binding MarR family transcriptional regulator